MAGTSVNPIRSTHPQLRDQQFIAVRPSDRRLSIGLNQATTARWEAAMNGPVYLVVGKRAPADQIERLAKRWSVPVEQVLAALVLS